MAANKNMSAFPGKDIAFRRAFRGYNTEEVDSYVEYTQTDIEALQRETYQLQRKLEEAYDEIEGYKRAEKVKKDLFAEAKEEADKIIHDAKTRAAHIIMRTSSQCNRIVADMVSQVEEQKNIYDATKKEILRFRTELFREYTTHIRKINAFVEAAGIFDSDALSDEDIDGFISVIHGNGDEDGLSLDYEIGDEVEIEVERIKSDAERTADRIYAEKKAEDLENGILNITRDAETESDDENAVLNIESEVQNDIQNSDIEAQENEKTAHTEAREQKEEIHAASEINIAPAKDWQSDISSTSDAHKQSGIPSQDDTSAQDSDVKFTPAVTFKSTSALQKERIAVTAEAETEIKTEVAPVITPSKKPDNSFFFSPDAHSAKEPPRTEPEAERPNSKADKLSDDAHDEEASFRKALEELEAVVDSAEKAKRDLDMFNLGKNASRKDGSNILTTTDDFNSLEENIAELNINLENDDGYGTANGYGFDISKSVKDGDGYQNSGFDSIQNDDDDEFYHEDDEQYVAGVGNGGRPTSSSFASLEIPASSDPDTRPKRWSVKKSMSLTDEFDAVEADGND